MPFFHTLINCYLFLYTNLLSFISIIISFSNNFENVTETKTNWYSYCSLKNKVLILNFRYCFPIHTFYKVTHQKFTGKLNYQEKVLTRNTWTKSTLFGDNFLRKMYSRNFTLPSRGDILQIFKKAFYSLYIIIFYFLNSVYSLLWYEPYRIIEVKLHTMV